MSKHADRGHAPWSASSAEANWQCAGRLAMIARVTTPEKENFPAAWGTACHQVSEKCLRTGKDPVDFIGTIEKTKEHTIEVDEEMAVTAEDYVGYIRGELAKYPDAKLYIETNFSLAALKPPIESGGTADAVIYYPSRRLIEVVDLKGGRGVVVEVKGNKQAKTYGLGAMLAYRGLAVDRVKLTIVQPRAGHRDGRTRSDEFHVTELAEWASEMLVRMDVAVEAQREFGKMPDAAWVAKYLKAGNHCTFCRAKEAEPLEGFPATIGCPAVAKMVEDQIGLWFDADDKPHISNKPSSMTPEQIAQFLDLADMIENHVNSIRAYAQTQAENGVVIPDYQLSERIGHRKWKGEDEAAVRRDLFLKADLSGDEVFNKKLKSPAQIEKVLGSKRKHLIENLVHRPVTGTSLVRADKTSRPAMPSRPERYFEPVEPEGKD